MHFPLGLHTQVLRATSKKSPTLWRLGFCFLDFKEHAVVKIIVTGIAGFIGFHCAKTLMAQGHTICGIDNINDYYLPALKEARLKNLAPDGDFTFHKIDLADQVAVNHVFKEFQPERVLHLAAQAGVRYSITHPHAYIHSNIIGTTNILEACRHNGKPRLVYASSSSVYGGNKELPFSEAQSVDHPISLYAATKKSNELMAHTYSHLYDMQTIGLRFFTVYGPWGRPDMAMWLFAEAARKGEPLKIFNHGNMRRDFTFIDDIVAGVIACLERENLDPYEVFNLGNHRCEALMDLVNLIETCIGKETEKIMMPMQDGDVEATWADIEKARGKLGFDPKTPMAEGVPQFIEWYKAHPQFHG